jgi:type IV pilus assembly protein PilY1
MAHPAAYVPDYTDFTADAVYVGDLNGQLWRFDINGTESYPAPTKIAQLASGSGVAQPITTQPLVQIHPKLRKRYVLVGTGRLLDTTDIANGQMQNFYGIADGGMGLGTFGAQAGDGQEFPATRARMADVTPPSAGSALPSVTGAAGWYINLGVDGTGGNAVNWRAISPATAFSSTVSFSTTLPAGDACSPSGNSRVYAVDFGSGRTMLNDANGNALSYVSVEGVVTDLNFARVEGKTRLIYGTSKGEPGKPSGNFDGRVLRKLLNWREMPLD